MNTILLIAVFFVIIYLFAQRYGSGRRCQRISPVEVKKRLDAGEKAFLVDVRTPDEYAEKHIANSLLVPLDRIEQQVNRKIPDKTIPLFVYCLSGSRSARAAGILVKLGYSNVYDMGAMRNWPGKMETGK